MLVFNNIIICWGKFILGTATGTVPFPITYTQVPRIVAELIFNNTNNAAYVYNRFPHTITVSGFSRTKATTYTDAEVDWISIGY